MLLYELNTRRIFRKRVTHEKDLNWIVWILCLVLRVLTLKDLSLIAGANGDEVPPVPIPNTEVKLISAEDTWWVTAWENRAVPAQLFL